MSRPRIYATNAERQGIYRIRKKAASVRTATVTTVPTKRVWDTEKERLRKRACRARKRYERLLS
jgi:hypothetical protein